jgi:hypothetical protein
MFACVLGTMRDQTLAQNYNYMQITHTGGEDNVIGTVSGLGVKQPRNRASIPGTSKR